MSRDDGKILIFSDLYSSMEVAENVMNYDAAKEELNCLLDRLSDLQNQKYALMNENKGTKTLEDKINELNGEVDKLLFLYPGVELY